MGIGDMATRREKVKAILGEGEGTSICFFSREGLGRM